MYQGVPHVNIYRTCIYYNCFPEAKPSGSIHVQDTVKIKTKFGSRKYALHWFTLYAKKISDVETVSLNRPMN
jgi:hypothetical protein